MPRPTQQQQKDLWNMSEIVDLKEVESYSLRREGFGFNILYDEKRRTLTIAYFDEYHYCDEVKIELDK